MGDGADIIATTDPWLRDKRDFHVEQSHMYAGKNEIMSSWFVPEKKHWDLVVSRSTSRRKMPRPF